MILASLHGYIFSKSVLMFTKFFSISSNLLNESLVVKLLPCKLIGVVNMKNSMVSIKKIGITRHVSCPRTHQKNGSVERKHHHIIDVGLALLANAFMPLKFWDEAFLTVTCLINLLPSKVLNFVPPFEKLLNVTTNYDSLHIFGCACWPNIRPYNAHKLAFRSKRCVFLGYSPIHKGVKCLDTSTGHVYISHDVVLDENIFPFHSFHPNTGSRLRKEILLLPSIAYDHGGVHTNDDHMPVIPITTHSHATIDEGNTNGDNGEENTSSEETSTGGQNSEENYEETDQNSEEIEGNNPGTNSHADSPVNNARTTPESLLDRATEFFSPSVPLAEQQWHASPSPRTE
jgi:hypothetical protein